MDAMWERYEYSDIEPFLVTMQQFFNNPKTYAVFIALVVDKSILSQYIRPSTSEFPSIR
jgi:hypothetical protein